MKYLAGLMLAMLVQVASATECRINGSNWADPKTHLFNVYVNVKANLDAGKVMLDDFNLECRHGMQDSFPFEYHQTISTSPNALELFPGHYEGGLATSVDHPIPVRGGIILSVQRKEPLVNVPVRPYLKITNAPGKYIQIKSGDKIAGVRLRGITSDQFNSTRYEDFIFDFHIYARNSLNLSPSTCTINNNAPINVDFGSVDPVAVGGDIPAGTPYRKSVTLSYSCPDRGIDSPVNIKLVGTASSFNSSALATTNPDLAAGIHRLSALVPPGGSFRTNINNSSGSDTVLFTLFRKPGSFPAAGPFTGSATLVMSVP